MLLEERRHQIVVAVVDQRRFGADVEREPVREPFELAAELPQPVHGQAGREATNDQELPTRYKPGPPFARQHHLLF